MGKDMYFKMILKLIDEIKILKRRSNKNFQSCYNFLSLFIKMALKNAFNNNVKDCDEHEM